MECKGIRRFGGYWTLGRILYLVECRILAMSGGFYQFNQFGHHLSSSSLYILLYIFLSF